MSITIKPVRFTENGFMACQFALGGEGAEGLDPAKYDGVAFENRPADWRCPRCKQPKDKFNRA